MVSSALREPGSSGSSASAPIHTCETMPMNTSHFACDCYICNVNACVYVLIHFICMDMDHAIVNVCTCMRTHARICRVSSSNLSMSAFAATKRWSGNHLFVFFRCLNCSAFCSKSVLAEFMSVTAFFASASHVVFNSLSSAAMRSLEDNCDNRCSRALHTHAHVSVRTFLERHNSFGNNY